MRPLKKFKTGGYLDAGSSREDEGLPMCKDIRVITNLCILSFDKNSKEMQVESIHPGVSREQIVVNTGFPIKFADNSGETAPPSEEEIYLLRNRIDPKRQYI